MLTKLGTLIDSSRIGTYNIFNVNIVSTPLAAGGAGYFGNFSVRGGWEIFGLQGGAAPLGGGSKI